ncbi:MAG: hypothetical protein HY329_26440 [Chloroflexi bacterium]|nr:hypothetical protein [Chloroflexota bacterium]
MLVDIHHVAYQVAELDAGHPVTNNMGWRIAYLTDGSMLGTTTHLIQI